MDLDVLTRLTATKREFRLPDGSSLAGLRLVRMGSNRIDPPAGQDLHRPDNRIHHLTWIVAGQALVREPGPPRLAAAGDVLVLPAGMAHRYTSTTIRGWRAVFVSFTCVDWDGLGLRPGVMRPSPAAARAYANLAALATTPGTSGPRIAAGLAMLLAELAAATPLGRADAAAEKVAAELRADPLRIRDVAELAAAHGLSWSALRQALRRRTGMSPQRLLRSARLARGAEALASGSTVGEAATAAGCADPFHFSRLFRRAYGVPPRAWREVAG